MASTNACLDDFIAVDRFFTIMSMMPTTVLSADTSPHMIDHSLDALSLDPTALYFSPRKSLPARKFNSAESHHQPESDGRDLSEWRG